VIALGVGGTAFYLICAFFGLAILGMAVNEWRHLDAADYQRLSAAALLVVVGRLVGSLLLLTGWAQAIACQEGLLEVVTIALFAWAFLYRTFPPGKGSRIYLIAVTLIVAGSLAWCMFVSTSIIPAQSPWPLLLLLLNGFALLQWWRHPRQFSTWLAFAFAASLVSAVLWLLGQAQLAQLSHLAALALFTIVTYLLITDDLKAYGTELQTVSAVTLQQTRDMALLLEVSQTIAGSLDLSTVLERVSESVARTVNADWAYLLLQSEGNDDELYVAARFGWWGSRWMQDPRVNKRVTVRCSEFSLLNHAVLRRRQVLANNREDYEQFDRMHARLARPQSGPTLIQPIYHQDRTLGVMLMGHIGRQRIFSEADGKMCRALMGQIAAAIDNAHLYQNMDEQARELAKLLRIREEEATQRQAILESIADGVIVAGQGGEVVLVNAAAERILNTSKEQLLGKTIKRLYAELLIATGRKTGKQAIFEWGDRLVRGSLAPVRMPNGKLLGYVAVFRDVTLERQAEKAKSRFVTTISHELRTPLTAIKGYTELMAAGAAGAMNAQQREFLQVVDGNTERMVSLVNNLIAVTELDRGMIEIDARPVDMGGVITEAVQAIRPEAAKRRLDITVDTPSDLPPVQGDASRLRQIMDNLLDNAIRYTPASGRITVWATPVELDSAAGGAKQFVVVNIRDTGVGIPPEEHDRIFERFHRVENPLSTEAGGSGMGLAIVKSLVEAHGGRIWVDSKLGQGSSFSFVIPTPAHRTRS
jgi:PAS domain S-box-containing protein